MHMTDFITPPVDTVAVLNSFTCLTCDYPGTTNEEWFRDGSIILGDHTDLCDCEVFPDEGRICFNSVTEADVDTYSCKVIVGFGQFCVSSADLILAGECVCVCVCVCVWARWLYLQVNIHCFCPSLT